MTAGVSITRADDADAEFVADVMDLAASAEDVAPLVEGVPDIVDGRVRLHPWIPYADVTALLSWVDKLDDPAPVALTRSTVGGTRITAVGGLSGRPVLLVADTHRVVAGAPGVVDLAALRAVAAAELAALGEQTLAGGASC